VTSTLRLILAASITVFAALPGAAQDSPRSALLPTFSIWDVQLGATVDTLPDRDVNDISCGTNGGPPSLPLKSFTGFAACAPEASGLREVYFIYDDEQDYVERAFNNEYRVVQGGTSIYAHPVIVSVLIDEAGIIQGIRIVTDDRASDLDRRQAVSLGRNLEARYGHDQLACTDVPPENGQQPLGRIFVHDICTATDSKTQAAVRFESRYFRKKGQAALDAKTQLVNRSYFESSTRLELTLPPYMPAPPNG
jgi:hypothetical protein